MTENVDPIYQLQSPWKEDSHNVWLATTLTLNRNLSKFKFPGKLDKEREEQIITLLFDSFKECKELDRPLLYRSNRLNPLDKEYLLEHFMIIDGFHMAHSGEGFAIDNRGDFLAVMNFNNHLQIQLLDVEQEIEKTWNRLIKIEECISRSVDFAYNSRFGFLTSDPSFCGTGLTITLFLHIPAIIHSGELPDLLERDKEEEIEAKGLQGSSQEMIGDILVARNACTLGVTEEYIMTSVRMWATRAVVAEITARKKLKDNPNELLKNKVARALGLLTHSYQLETIEALNALSLVKLGVELGWIETKTSPNLLNLFFNSRRAHLISVLKQKVEIPELPRKRADFLQEMTKDLKLTI